MGQIYALFAVILFVGCQPAKPKDPNTTAERNVDNSKAEYEVSAEGSGGRIGNGGSGIICLEGHKISSIRLFDFYEAEVLRDWHVDFDYVADKSKPLLEQSLDVARELVKQRWSVIDPVMAKYLEERLDAFSTETQFIDKPMSRVYDLESLLAPPNGCLIGQVAIQRKQEKPGDKRYYIQRSLFEHTNFSNLDRAGLIIHELMYRLTSLRGASNSNGARYMTSVFFAGKHTEFLTPRRRYFEVAKDAEMPWAGVLDLAIRLDRRFEFRNDELLLGGSVLPGGLATTPFGKHKIACYAIFDHRGIADHFSLVAGESRMKNISHAGLPLFDLIGRFSHLLPSFDWEKSFPRDYCDELGSKFDYATLTPLLVEATVFYGKLEPCIQATEENNFYRLNICLGSNVIVQKSGKVLSGSGESAGELVFTSGDRCYLFSLANGGGEVHRCIAKIPGERVVRIEGRVSVMNNRLRLSLDSQSTHLFKHRAGLAEISLNLKPGSQIDFDHSGKIIAALILDEVEICTDEGLQKTFLANTMLNFDQNGCVTFAHAVSSDF